MWCQLRITAYFPKRKPFVFSHTSCEPKNRDLSTAGKGQSFRSRFALSTLGCASESPISRIASRSSLSKTTPGGSCEEDVSLVGLDTAILIVDGTNLACRAAADARSLNTDIPVQFQHALQRLQRLARPSGTVVVFDPRIQRTSGSYKLHRRAKAQKRRLRAGGTAGNPRGPSRGIQKAALESGAHVVVAPSEAGCEADDVIATLCHELRPEGLGGHQSIVVASGDSDMQQVLHGDAVEAMFHEEFGFPPERYADYLALSGKPEAGVQGIRGLGSKSAKKLIQRYDTILGVLAAQQAGQLKGWPLKVQQALTNPQVEDDALQSLDLVKLKIDRGFIPDTLVLESFDVKKVLGAGTPPPPPRPSLPPAHSTISRASGLPPLHTMATRQPSASILDLYGTQLPRIMYN
ncbi:hypothetical protein CYMTET_34197 [Cymbomonas tetramitiformis]|uniref:5'-3' exonuclease domain-containing protein n=1 Tax=Cymbomonas tetramitiformis TaxID=36881 RepID=A0AAE0FBP2_9CHLO|nr:hypothetical protein CYMTET_34197 [Cymbomonas tetramitiformis]